MEGEIENIPRHCACHGGAVGVNELDEFLARKVAQARADGKTEDWIKGMTTAFNRYRSDNRQESADAVKERKAGK